MAGDDQVFHYRQGLKNKIRAEIERSEVTSLQEAMIIADRMDNVCSNSTFSFSGSPFNGATPNGNWSYTS